MQNSHYCINCYGWNSKIRNFHFIGIVCSLLGNHLSCHCKSLVRWENECLVGIKEKSILNIAGKFLLPLGNLLRCSEVSHSSCFSAESKTPDLFPNLPSGFVPFLVHITSDNPLHLPAALQTVHAVGWGIHTLRTHFLRIHRKKNIFFVDLAATVTPKKGKLHT